MTDGVQLGLMPVTNGTLTPVEKHGDVWVKRDDLYTVAGVCGGKARACWDLARYAKGLVTAGSRQSPQVNIVAQIAKHLNIPCRVHTPTGDLSSELLDAKAAGAEVVQHTPGYNTVIIARAREDAAELGWTNIPFGMECAGAVMVTSRQAENIPNCKRIVVPVGSGMSLAGILWGLAHRHLEIPVLGIMVGADPTKRLKKYAPEWLRKRVLTLEPSGVDYHTNVDAKIDDIKLDPVYEAKCVPFIEPGDLFWIVGIRRTA